MASNDFAAMDVAAIKKSISILAISFDHRSSQFWRSVEGIVMVNTAVLYAPRHDF
jgi:hypothetical protein